MSLLEQGCLDFASRYIFGVSYQFSKCGSDLVAKKLNEYVSKELKPLYFRNKLNRILSETFPSTLRIQLIFYLVVLKFLFLTGLLM